MKFEQYKMLKEHALAACAAAGAPFPATKEINPILLAYSLLRWRLALTGLTTIIV